MRRVLCVLTVYFCMSSFTLEINEDAKKNYFLSSPKSGTNLVLASMAAIIKKPVATIDGIYQPNTNGRIDIEFQSKCPFIFRAHNPDRIEARRAENERLIFLTRNPKELLFRDFSIHSVASLNSKCINNFLRIYIKRFRYYESWKESNRTFIFYEDVIMGLDAILLDLLGFIEEEPLYIEDFLSEKEINLASIRNHYKNQHKKQCKSSRAGPKAVYYSKGKDPELLKAIDEKLKQMDPYIYDKYLKRFEY